MEKTYELNGASAKDAALWFLMRERQRHSDDIDAINRDIFALLAQGAGLPDMPTLDTFITVPGVVYPKAGE